MQFYDDDMTIPIGWPTCTVVSFFPKDRLSPVGPPVEIPPNEPRKPPVEEPGEPYKKPPIPEIPPVEEPWDVPSEPPIKEPPPEDPDQIPPQPHTVLGINSRLDINTAYTP